MDAERGRAELEPDLGLAEPDLGMEEYDEDDLEQVGTLQSLLQNRRRVLGGLLLVILLIVAIYVLFPKVLGLDEAVEKLDEGTWYWVLVAIGFNVVAFAAYVALFRGVLGGMRDDEVRRRLDVRASYQITMAGLAATRIFSAGGAGGVPPAHWGPPQGGVPRRARHAARLASGPATVATGVRTAIDYVRHPRRGALAVAGAAGFWAANIGVLWAAFEAFDGDVPFAVLGQGFLVGM